MELRKRIVDIKPYAKPYIKQTASVPKFTDVSMLKSHSQLPNYKVQLPPLKRMHMGLSGWKWPETEDPPHNLPRNGESSFTRLFPLRRTRSTVKRPVLEDPEVPLKIHNKCLDRISKHREEIIKVENLLK